MEIDYKAQTLLAIYSVPVGFLLGAVYDVFRLVRLPFGKIGVFITDVIQVFLCFFSVQILLYNFWSGKIRIYPFVICFIGMVIYRITVGRAVTALFIKLNSYITPRILLQYYRVKGYIIKKRLLKQAVKGFGIKFSRRN